MGETFRIIRIAGGAFLATLFLLPAQLLALRFKWSLRTKIPVLWHRAMLRLLGIRVHVHGAPANVDNGLLLAANHVSWLDIPVLGSLTALSFIAKDDIQQWGFFGKLAQWQRTVFVMRERRSQAAQQASDISERLDQGDTLVLFPEGTTSDGNFIYTFKSSLFGALGLAGGGHCVQPVAIVYTRLHGQPMGRYDRPIVAWPGDIELMPHLMNVVRRGVVDVDVCFGDVITTPAQMDRKILTAQVQEAVSMMAAAALRGRLTSSQPDQSALLDHDDE